MCWEVVRTNGKRQEGRERGRKEERGKEGGKQRNADHSYVVSFLFVVCRSRELSGIEGENQSGRVGMLSWNAKQRTNTEHHSYGVSFSFVVL